MVPAAHQGSTPTSDPRIAGLTPGGDTAQPPNARERRWLVLPAAVLVLAVGALLLWLFLRVPSDASAREAAAADGIVVLEKRADAVRVAVIESGYRILLDDDRDGGVTTAGREYLIERADGIGTEPSDDWEPFDWPGVDASQRPWPEPMLVIDAGARQWWITPGVMDIVGAGDRDGGSSAESWYHLREYIDFMPGVAGAGA